MEGIHIMGEKSNVSTVANEIISAELTEEPFYIFDIPDLLGKIENWKKLMPRIDIFYAVKCNDHPLVFQILSELNVGFDCATKGEIQKVLNLGVSPKKIIFANPTKLLAHLRYSKNVGVSLLTFDSFLELDKIWGIYPNADLVLRIKYDDPEASVQFGEKFGCCHKTEAQNLLERAQKLGLNVVGVSFHIGSGSKTSSIFKSAIEASKHVFEIAKKLGFNFNLLDIGGGFPGQKGSSIMEISNCINEALDEHFPDKNIKIIAEPGTYIVKSAFTLFTQIHSIRDITTNNGEKLKMYYVTAGIFNGLLDHCFCNKFHIKPVKKRKIKETHKSIIWGPTLDSCDKLGENLWLPKLKLGDWLKIEDAGAYTICLNTRFNSFPSPKVIGVMYENSLGQ